MSRWPNFFIVGAPRAGSSSLYEYLRQVPEIYMSTVKEPNYFAPNAIPDNFKINPIRNKKEYLKLFKKAKDEKILGEASPSYLRDTEAPKLIHEVLPDAKILISLRNPINQIFSNYLMNASLGYENKPFREAINNSLTRKKLIGYQDLIQGAMYYQPVKRYLETFGENQVKIIIFEEFIKNTGKMLNDILDFLGVKSTIPEIMDKSFNPFSIPRGKLARFVLTSGGIRKISNKIVSPSMRIKLKENLLLKGVKKPEMKEDDKKFLQSLFKEDVKNLEILLGYNFPWKDFHKK